MIDTDTYCLACKFKKAQILVVLMRNLELQAKKKTRLEIDVKSVILNKYHNFLDIFLKINSDTFSFHQKYDCEIILKE